MNLAKITGAIVLSAATIAAGIVSLSLTASAEDMGVMPHSIVVRAKERAVVSRGEVHLADIATVEGRSMKDDEAVVALEQIVLAKDLKPGVTVTLTAHQILNELRDAEVDFATVGYEFPKLISVTRSGRKVQGDEIRRAVEQFLGVMNRDATVQSVKVKNDVMVPVSDISFQVEPQSTVKGGLQAFSVKAFSEGAEVSRFQVDAELNEWREVPVASRPLLRGALIGQNDFMRARLNTSQLPRDAAFDDEELIGLKLSSDVGPGQVFRRASLIVPPLIQAGEQVTLRYQAGALTATARGVALEGGAAGQTIRVRNPSSKKVVEGVLREDRTIEVLP